MNIIFYTNIYKKTDLDMKYINTKLIMIKLFSQILENINESELDDLYNCIIIYDKEVLKFENPFIYLYEKIIDELIQKKIIIKILNKYYIRLLLICLNKLKNEGKIVEKLIKNNLSTIILLLFSDKSSDISENEFINKIIYSKNFENEALFNSEDQNLNKNGKIICYIKYELKKQKYNFDDSFNSYLNNDNNIDYDDNIFRYDINNESKYDDALVIRNDILESDFYNLTNIKIKKISDIKIIKTDNNYQKLFISNYSSLIFNIINEEIIKDSLNEKGIYFVLNIFLKLIDYNKIYMNKDNILLIFKYIWKYYNKNKNDENKNIFMSLEFIEDIMDKYYHMYSQSYSGIYKQNKDNIKNSLQNLFIFIIIDNSIGIFFELNKKITWYDNCLKNLIIDEKSIKDINKSINIIYDKIYQSTNLSFFKIEKNFKNKYINDDSILFTESINNINDILELSDLIANNKNKIKVIIVLEINKQINSSEFSNFIANNSIPIYIIDRNIYNIMIDCFLKGKGNLINNYKFNFTIETKKENENKKEDGGSIINYDYNFNKKYCELIDDTRKIYHIGNIKLIKRMICDILYCNSIKNRNSKIYMEI